ncbi:hypothetical protein [Streptomyces canus]|uniref:hypothetical protein n=1 Tax=Streptomyces canus TaxID=58343 RepID=UPI0036E32A06
MGAVWLLTGLGVLLARRSRQSATGDVAGRWRHEVVVVAQRGRWLAVGDGALSYRAVTLAAWL